MVYYEKDRGKKSKKICEELRKTVRFEEMDLIKERVPDFT